MRYKRISRGELPPNIVTRRTYTQRDAPRDRRRRAAQQGQGIFGRNPLVKSIARKSLEYVPGAYANFTKRVKRKTLKRILNSDLAHSTLNKTIRAAFKMSKGLSNFQTNDFFKDEENEILKSNYMGTY